MAKTVSLILISATFLFLRPLTAKALDQKKGLLSENQAYAMVIQKVKDDGLYSDWTKIECLSFSTEEINGDIIDIAVNENHKGDCPGDPDTAPTIDRFRILRSSKKLLWYNVVEDAFVDYNPKNIHR